MTETAIADHERIGGLQAAALITTEGSGAWCCCPRFDSPRAFGALPDDARGRRLRIRPAGTDQASKGMYVPDAAVLVTRFTASDDELVTDSLVHPDTALDRPTGTSSEQVQRG